MDDDVSADNSDSARKHRRRGVAMVTSEALVTLGPEWLQLHRAMVGASTATHPDAFEGRDDIGTVWLSVRIDDALVGVVVLEMGLDAANVSVGPGYVGLLVTGGNEVALAEGVLEWLWEDLTEAFEVDAMQISATMLAAFVGAAERLGWKVEQGGGGLTLSQRR